MDLLAKDSRSCARGLVPKTLLAILEWASFHQIVKSKAEVEC
jgi:hypothetical protein